MRTLAGSLSVALWLAGSASAADLVGLMRDLKSRDADVRRSAATELGRLGVEAKPATEALVRALRDEDLYVRRFAAQALGEIGPEGDGAVSGLQTALRDKDRRVVEAAAGALGKMGSAAVKSLAAVVKDSNRSAEVRRVAIESLGKIGPDARSAVPALIDVIKVRGPRRPATMDMEQVVRLEAIQTLGKIGPEASEALKPLEELAATRIRDRNFKRTLDEAIRKIKK